VSISTSKSILWLDAALAVCEDNKKKRIIKKGRNFFIVKI
jgi:hypothetical protein